MVIELIIFFVGLFLLIKGSDYIVDSSSAIAKRIGVSSLVIGLTVVAFGTSLPELVVNVFAAIEGTSGVAFGNIVGSNIANILLVLGTIAVVGNINVKSMTVWREIPIALLAAFLLFVFSVDTPFGNGRKFIGPVEGIVFLCFFGLFLYFMYQSTRYDREKRGFSGKFEPVQWKVIVKLILGLVAIYFGGRMVVKGAVFFAEYFGLSEFFISATIIAVGTSLPELFVSLVAAIKGKVGLAVGNIVGSNIFNVFWVFGIISVIRPIPIPVGISFDLAVMFLSTLLLFIFMFTGKRHELRRKDGVLFLILYLFYLDYLIKGV